MIRLFVALDVPEDIRMLICGMGGSIPGARATPVDQLHLTVRFIGEVESGMLPDIKEALTTVSAKSLTFCMKHVGYFPPRGNPRVLWAGIEPNLEVIALRNTIERELAKVGIKKEGRKFSPHITLARLKNSPLKRVTQFLSGNAMFETPPFMVDEFTLYSSTLSQKGAVHTCEAIFRLNREGVAG